MMALKSCRHSAAFLGAALFAAPLFAAGENAEAHASARYDEIIVIGEMMRAPVNAGKSRCSTCPPIRLWTLAYPAASGRGAHLNVNNLFDKRYFPDSCCADRATPGEPRNWRLSLSRTF